MADTVTTKLALVKPEVGASDDTWGAKLNANFNTLDNAVVQIGSTATIELDGQPLLVLRNNVKPGVNGTIGGILRFNGYDSDSEETFLADIYADFKNATDASEKGRIRLRVNVNEALVDRLLLDDLGATVTGTLSSGNITAPSLVSAGASLILGANDPGTVYLRPNGDAACQLVYDTNGNITQTSKAVGGANLFQDRADAANGANGMSVGSILHRGKSNTGVQRVYASIVTSAISAVNAAETGKITFNTINAGVLSTTMVINNDNVAITGALSVSGNLTITGATTTFAGNLVSTSATMIIGMTPGTPGDIYLRPTAWNSGVGQMRIMTNGDTSIAGKLTVTGDVVSTIYTAAGQVTLATGVAGNILLRPNGSGSNVGQFVVASTGAVTVNGTLTATGAVTVNGTLTATGAITSAGSTVKTDANIAYTGTTDGNTAFPVGTVVMAYNSTAALARNAVGVVRISSVAGMYQVGEGAGAVLAGTWNSRGAINPISGAYYHLMQRTA